MNVTTHSFPWAKEFFRACRDGNDEAMTLPLIDIEKCLSRDGFARWFSDARASQVHFIFDDDIIDVALVLPILTENVNWSECGDDFFASGSLDFLVRLTTTGAVLSGSLPLEMRDGQPIRNDAVLIRNCVMSNGASRWENTSDSNALRNGGCRPPDAMASFMRDAMVDAGRHTEDDFATEILSLQEVYSNAIYDCDLKAYDLFRSLLDQDALAASEKAHYPGFAYNWIVSAPGPRGALLRRQALESYPMLIGEYLSSGSETEAIPPDIETAIDGEHSLTEALSEKLALPLAAIRTLRIVTFDIAELFPGFGLRSLAKAHSLSSFPPGHWPVQGTAIPLRDQWLGMAHTLEILERLEGRCSREKTSSILGKPTHVAFAKEPANWKTEKELNVDFFFDAETYSRPIYDTANAFNRQLLLPCATDAAEAYLASNPGGERIPLDEVTRLLSRKDSFGRTALSIAFGRGRTIKQMTQDSHHWHKHRHLMDAAISANFSLDQWEPLFATRNVAGLDAVSLFTLQDLEEEGFAQRHCVVTYAGRCLWEGSHIVSLREPDGRRVSTLEFKVATERPGGGSSIELTQHLAAGNQPAPEEAIRAAEELLSGIRSGMIRVDWQHIEEHRLRRQDDRSQDNFNIEIGYDADDQQARNTALQQWKFALPASDRGLSHSDWAAKLGLPEMLLASWHAHLSDPETIDRMAKYRLDHAADDAAAQEVVQPALTWFSKIRSWF